MSTSQPTPPVPPPMPPANHAPKTSGLAIASLVCGIVSVLGAALLVIPSLLAIIFGHVSMSKIRKTPGLGGWGLGLAGCILGYVSIVFGILMVGLLGAMAIPAFEKVRAEAMRKSLQNDARQIAAAAQQYMMENGVEEVAFSIDPSTGAVSGPLSTYLSEVNRGTQQVDGVVEYDGTFSLRHPRAFDGQEMIFTVEGELQ